MDENNKLKLTKEEFEPALVEVLQDIKNKIITAKAVAKGKLKANPMHRLYDEGKLSKDFVLNEMPKLQNKTSTQPRVVRDILSDIIRKSIRKAYLKQAKERLDKEAEKK